MFATSILKASTQFSKRALYYQLFVTLIVLLFGCASSWSGRVIHVKNNLILIQLDKDVSIKPGKKMLIYREQKVTHPVTGEELGQVEDEITQTFVLSSEKTKVIAFVERPWSEMIRPMDSVKPVRGTIKPNIRRLEVVGYVTDMASGDQVVFTVNDDQLILPSDNLYLAKYTNSIKGADGGNIIAVEVKIFAELKLLNEMSSPKNFLASYVLQDKASEWVDIGDVVIKGSQGAIKTNVWFIDPPRGFADNWIFDRYYNKAVRDYENGLFREAIAELNQVINYDPNYKDTKYLLGLCYMNIERYDEAVAIFNQQLSYDRTDPKAQLALAYCYLKQNKIREACKCYEELSLLMPDNPDILVDLGDLYKRIGETEKAIDAYKRAVEIDKNNQEALFELKDVIGSDQRPNKLRQ